MSMVDLMLTVSLIAVMMWGVISMDGWLRERFAREKTRSALSALREAMLAYRGANGVWPAGPSAAAVGALLADPRTGPMIQGLRLERNTNSEIQVLDGYGQPMGYVVRGRETDQSEADFVSVGPDGRLGNPSSDDPALRLVAIDDLYGSDVENP